MKDLLDLIIIIAISYFIIKLSYKFISKLVSNLTTDKDKILKDERMKYENTFFSYDFERVKPRLTREGFNTEGAYIFTNQNNNEVYVGQSVDLLRRINQHLNGRGNEDVYEAIADGDEFTIRLIKLKDTEFPDLDSLEKYYITKYNSYYMGYNKTKGNG